MIRVCPNPQSWGRVYTALKAASIDADQRSVEPPRLLILNGWVFSSDQEKAERWLETVAWAAERGLSHIIATVPEDDWYEVRAFSPPGWLEGYFAHPLPQSRPSEADLVLQLSRLLADWREIAGEPIWSSTKPLKFTGRKRRRLVVLADARVRPPWGSWNSFEQGGDRASFAALRRSVNDHITPHAVDSIDFVLTTNGV